MILQPPAVLQIGAPGSGKTSATITALLMNIEVFVIVTEPDGVSSLLDAAERLKAPIDRLHWRFCPAASQGWKGIEDMISRMNSMDQKGLADVKDMGKIDFRPTAMQFLEAFRNFHDDRTGQDFGDFTTWDDSKMLVVDSLTGWSHIGWGTVVGYKPTANPGEWGIAQKFISNMLLKIQNDRRCFFSMTAHMEKEMDEIVGVKRVMVSTIGSKLAPQVPTFFSEVVLSKRIVDSKGQVSFVWSNKEVGIDLKNRSLPISDSLSPDFKPVIEAYWRKKKIAEGQSQTAPQPTTAAPQTPPVMPAAPLSPTSAAQQRTTNS